ncbi:MAG: hypothetical protein ACUVTN_12210 [Thermodesulfobacteriota bacterium]
MNRRKLMKIIFFIPFLASFFFVQGCGRKENYSGFGNQEKLWNLIETQEKIEEPLDLAYLKGNPAFYRDSSFAKEDTSFVPKISGG